MSGSGGLPPKGSVVGELIVKAFYGELKPTGFERYAGMWKGPPPGAIGKRDVKIALDKLKEFMKAPLAAMVTKGGFGPGALDDQKVADDGKGWVWLAADMSPGGLAVELFKSVPYGKRALFAAKQSNVDEAFNKVNWDAV